MEFQAAGGGTNTGPDGSQQQPEGNPKLIHNRLSPIEDQKE